MNMKTALARGIEHYEQPRTSTDIDLVAAVRTRMVASGLGLRLPQAFDQNRFIQEAHGKASDVQRFLLNRYWGQQLMSATKISIEERYCLIPDGSVEDWLSLWESKVLPFIIENSLPIAV